MFCLSIEFYEQVRVVLTPEHFTSRVLVEPHGDQFQFSMLSTIATLRPSLRKRDRNWSRHLDERVVLPSIDPPPTKPTFLRGSAFNSSSSEIDDEVLVEMLFARGHCVEQFAFNALRSHCSAKRVKRGRYAENDELKICGTPDATLSNNRKRYIIEVKSTTRTINNELLLGWLLQVKSFFFFIIIIIINNM